MTPYRFGWRSKMKLATADERWLPVCYAVINHFDFSVLHGFRWREEQNALVEAGYSKTPWPLSDHNRNRYGENRPGSLAIDVAPYRDGGIDWSDTPAFVALYGMLRQAAHSEGLIIAWGGDWDQDDQFIKDQTFNDLGHVWIVGEV